MAKLYKKKNQKTTTDYIREGIQFLIYAVVSLYMLLMLGILPYYNQEGFLHIGTDKSIFFRTWGSRFGKMALVLFVVYVIFEIIARRGKISITEIGKKFTETDLFAVCFAIMVLVSHVCSNYQEEAKLGANGWYMGTLAQMIMVGSYLFISMGWKANRILPLLTLPVSFVVFLLGILNKFSVYPFDMKAKSSAFISTIGNVNWYCGYLVVILFFGIGYFVFEDKMKQWQRILLAAYLLLGIAALETQGSDSGIFALAVILVMLFLISSRDRVILCRFSIVVFILAFCGLVLYIIRKRQLLEVLLAYTDRGTELLTNTPFAVFFFLIALALLIGSIYIRKKELSTKIIKMLSVATAILSCAVLIGYVAFVAVNTSKQGELSDKLGLKDRNMFVYSANWGSNRGATWGAGIHVFAEQDLEHKLVGVGPDCMCAYIYSDGSEELLTAVRKTFGNARLTNAHNEWLTVLIDLGILGLIGYAGMILSAIFLFLKQGSRNAYTCACGLAVLAYTLNNIFSFQQSMCTPTMFIFMGIGAAWLKREKEKELPN